MWMASTHLAPCSLDMEVHNHTQVLRVHVNIGRAHVKFPIPTHNQLLPTYTHHRMVRMTHVVQQEAPPGWNKKRQ